MSKSIHAETGNGAQRLIAVDAPGGEPFSRDEIIVLAGNTADALLRRQPVRGLAEQADEEALRNSIAEALEEVLTQWQGPYETYPFPAALEQRLLTRFTELTDHLRR